MENFNNDALIDLLSGVNKTYNSKEVHDYNYYSKYIGLSVHSSGFYGKQVGNKVIPLELTDFVFNSKEDIVLIVEGRVTLKQAPVNNGIGNLYIKGYGFLVVNDSITYDGRLSTNGDVTKSYVDLNDALTLQAAKDYTDANMGVVGVLPYEDDTYNAGWITGDILEGVVDTMFLLQNGNASQSLIITPPSTSSIDGAIFGVKDGSSGTNISGNAVLSGFYGVSGDLQFMKPGETIIFRCFNNIWSVLTRYNKSYSTKKNLSELDDVSFTTLGNKHIPYYDTNVNLWTNLPISGVLGYTPESTNNKVTNLNSPNDEDYPTTNTVKTYVDNAVVGLLNDRGSYNPVSGQYPTTGGSGVGGVPKKGDIWYISANGTINGISVTAGSSVRAIANSPGQTDANWDILDVGLGYVPENLANKITSILGNETNVDRYTSAKAVVDYVTSAISSIPSYSGTPNRITVTGSTIDIASTYAGQTSITTLGTIGTGTWQGTAIADAYIASAANWNSKFNTPTGLTTNNTLKWNGSQIVNANETDNGTTITSTLNRIFTGASGSNNGTGVNSNKFLFDGNNTSASASASHIQIAPQMQVPAGSIGGSLRGIVFLDGNANSYVNNGFNQLYINSGGDLVDSKITLRRAIYINHRSADTVNNGNANSSAVTIDATMFRPTISAVTRNGTGVHHITSVNADNYSSIVQAGASGLNPVHYSAYSQRDNAIAFSHYKDASVSSGVLNHARNILASNTTTFSNGFGFKTENFLFTSNTSTIVQLDEEYIVQNVGTGTTTSGKRYRHIGTTNGVSTAYIMGLYAGGVIIGNTTALPNTLCSLDLDSTTKGLGLNLIAGDLGTTRNGNIWYNTVSNTFKGIANATVRTLAFAGDTYKFDEIMQLPDCNAVFSTANTGVYMTFIPKGDITVTKIYYNLQSAGTDTVRVAIYADGTNTPTTLIVQGNEAITGATTTGHRSVTVSSTNLTAGTRYWIAIKNDNGACSFLSRNNVYSNNITRESFTSGVFVASPAPSSSTNAIWLGLGV